MNPSWSTAFGTWLRGANYIPRTAINPIEMWHPDTFDPDTIDEELGWAANLGFNIMRVFLHNLAWEPDPEAFSDRLDRFLGIATRHGIGTMFVFFDDVWNPEAIYGPQPAPIPHVHNSGWVQCPTAADLADPSRRAALEAYVRSILGRFGRDDRIVLWDLFNEPDNDNGGRFAGREAPDKTALAFGLLRDVFRWTAEAAPIQPYTVGLWKGDWSDHDKMTDLEKLMVSASPIISFHNYDSMDVFARKAASLARYDKPIVCTEYMARPFGNTFGKMLPYMKEHGIGAINWGFVEGKSQTNYPWDSWQKKYDREPDLWFHDILRSDGRPYDQSEADLLRSLCRS